MAGITIQAILSGTKKIQFIDSKEANFKNFFRMSSSKKSVLQLASSIKSERAIAFLTSHDGKKVYGLKKVWKALNSEYTPHYSKTYQQLSEDKKIAVASALRTAASEYLKKRQDSHKDAPPTGKNSDKLTQGINTNCKIMSTSAFYRRFSQQIQKSTRVDYFAKLIEILGRHQMGAPVKIDTKQNKQAYEYITQNYKQSNKFINFMIKFGIYNDIDIFRYFLGELKERFLGFLSLNDVNKKNKSLLDDDSTKLAMALYAVKCPNSFNQEILDEIHGNNPEETQKILEWLKENVKHDYEWSPTTTNGEKLDEQLKKALPGRTKI